MNYHVEQVSPSGNIILVALLSISRLERQATTVRREGSKDDYFLVFQIPIYILLIKKKYIYNKLNNKNYHLFLPDL